MKTNMGGVDKVMRILAAGAIVALYCMHRLTGTLAVWLLLAAAVFIITSFIGFCPLYAVFGIRTHQQTK